MTSLLTLTTMKVAMSSQALAKTVAVPVLYHKFLLLLCMTTILLPCCANARGFPQSHLQNSIQKLLHRLARAPHASASLTNASTSQPLHSINVPPSSSSSMSSSSPSVSSKDNIPDVQKAQLSHSASQKMNDDWSLIPESATKAQLVSILISTLERLNVTKNSSNDSCFRLQKIVQSGSSSSSSLSSSVPSTLEVHLYFQEIPHQPMHSSQYAVSNSAASKQPVDVVNGDSGSNNRSVLDSSCASDPDIVILVPRAHEDVAQERNGTVPPYDENTTSQSNESKGLSRTQIVVISTCSAIIGMFFLVAAILRIRNYIKRARMEQALAKRPKFRSCSVALRGTAQSMEQLRRDSLASKGSHQNSVTTKGSNGSQTNGSSRENSSSNSPRHNPDTAPLLLLTRAQQQQQNEATTPTESHSSLQYIDEEIPGSKKKAIPPSSLTRQPESDSTKVRPLQGLAADRINPSRTGSLKTPSPSTVITDPLKTFKQNGQIIKGKEEEGGLSPTCTTRRDLYQPVNSGYNTRRDLYQPINSGYNPVAVVFRGTPLNNKSSLKARSSTKLSEGYTPLSSEVTDSDPVTGVAQNREKLEHDIPTQSLSKSTDGMYTPSDSLRNERVLDQCATNPPFSNAEKPQLSLSVNQQIQSDPTCQDFLNLTDHPGAAAEDDAEENEKKKVLDDKDFLSPLSDVSYFGLSQSDVSLTSVSNQGNEFFGQEEYRAPCEMLTLMAPCNESASNITFYANSCDDNLGSVDTTGPLNQYQEKTVPDTMDSEERIDVNVSQAENMPSPAAEKFSEISTDSRLSKDETGGRYLYLQSSQPSVDSGINIHSDLDSCTRANSTGEEASPTTFGPFLSPTTPVKSQQFLDSHSPAFSPLALFPLPQRNTTERAPTIQSLDASPSLHPPTPSKLDLPSSSECSRSHFKEQEISVNTEKDISASRPALMSTSSLGSHHEGMKDDATVHSSEQTPGQTINFEDQECPHSPSADSSDEHSRSTVSSVPMATDMSALVSNELCHQTSGQPHSLSSHNQVVNPPTLL